MLHRTPRAAAVLVPLLLLAACGDDDESSTTTVEITGDVTVLAASSLTDAFEEIALAFEIAHVGSDVHLSFDGSSALATQIQEGVPADVFASADEASAAKVTAAGLDVDGVVPFASNRLQIVVPRGNPGSVTALADLAEADLRLALCAPEVPCGRYAAQAFERAGIAVPAASQEENVRGVLTKVALGEADAGIVYVTDVVSDPDVQGVDLPDEVQVPAVYPALVLRAAANLDAAAAFVAFLVTPQAQRILSAHGFGPPAP